MTTTTTQIATPTTTQVATLTIEQVVQARFASLSQNQLNRLAYEVLREHARARASRR